MVARVLTGQVRVLNGVVTLVTTWSRISPGYGRRYEDVALSADGNILAIGGYSLIAASPIE